MLAHLRANMILLVATLLLCAVLYPLAILAIGQGLFPASASGSLIAGADGNPVGSRLIAQEFKGDGWFHPRPSAADYNAAASGGSNLSANHPKLRERAEAIIQARGGRPALPADAVTASGSGLDPHITLTNARSQVDRVTSAWAGRTRRDTAEVRATLDDVLTRSAFRPLGGVVGGEELVNVLEVNAELALIYRTTSPSRSTTSRGTSSAAGEAAR
ncbi:MAG: potassium-transporting ATPase subunit C [Gemmataceae bacterium]